MLRWRHGTEAAVPIPAHDPWRPGLPPRRSRARYVHGLRSPGIGPVCDANCQAWKRLPGAGRSQELAVSAVRRPRRREPTGLASGGVRFSAGTSTRLSRATGPILKRFLILALARLNLHVGRHLVACSMMSLRPRPRTPIGWTAGVRENGTQTSKDVCFRAICVCFPPISRPSRRCRRRSVCDP